MSKAKCLIGVALLYSLVSCTSGKNAKIKHIHIPQQQKKVEKAPEVPQPIKPVYKKEPYPSCLDEIVAVSGEYVAVVDKQNFLLYVFEYTFLGHNLSGWKQRARFPVATGRNPGDKFYEGDGRTPEGNYKIEMKMTTYIDDPHYSPYLVALNNISIAPSSRSKNIGFFNAFGTYAFLLNYPNDNDIKLGKTGGNIMVHEIRDESLLGSRATNGCISLSKKHMQELYSLMRVNSKILIRPNLYWKNLP
ncbi:MAG: L,D-transpeptidase [Candidatus Woesearchaeota archaeon]